MKHMKTEDRQDDGARPSQGDTVTAQGENQSPKARQPHERDESADSQKAENSSMPRVGGLAHDDAVGVQQDTSKAKELDATYHRMRQDAEPAPVDKVNRNQRNNG
ncbi:MAG TPA: hypothetical protein VHL79_14600 [Ramlibacter sp.]|jgi:hypothetical protein|nr:hypothetical protein [Ramlibacter sp.]